MDQLKIGEDFYYNEDGYVVLTEKYHRDKGYCCGNGCLHCPFEYINTPEAQRRNLLEKRAAIEAPDSK